MSSAPTSAAKCNGVTPEVSRDFLVALTSTPTELRRRTKWERATMARGEIYEPGWASNKFTKSNFLFITAKCKGTVPSKLGRVGLAPACE